MAKPCWRVHFLCKSNAVLGDEIPYLCLQIGYLGFSKFWLFDFKILKNQQFVFQHTQLFYFYNYQKTVDTYPRYCTLDCNGWSLWNWTNFSYLWNTYLLVQNHESFHRHASDGSRAISINGPDPRHPDGPPDARASEAPSAFFAGRMCPVSSRRSWSWPAVPFLTTLPSHVDTPHASGYPRSPQWASAGRRSGGLISRAIVGTSNSASKLAVSRA